MIVSKKKQDVKKSEDDVIFDNFRAWVKTTDDPVGKGLQGLMFVKLDKPEENEESE